MQNQTILCPHCKKPISLDDAFTTQIKSDLEETLRQEAGVREKQLQEEFQRQITQERKTAEERISKDLVAKNQHQLELLTEQLGLEKKKRLESEEKELVLHKREVELEDQQRRLQLDIARQMEEERKIIREKTEAEIIERERHKELEKDKQIQDLKHLLEDAQRKANQGSQQTQGEVQELELERLLKEAFPHDQIEPVGKGVSGADMRQIVKSPGGIVCGTILWESKQTKTWSEGWISKLKNDVRNEKANIPALVSSAPCETNWSGMSLHDGVWVCNFALFLPMAKLLRQSLLDVARQKVSQQHQGRKADEIYEFITSTEFRQQMEAMVESYHSMRSQLTKERIAMEKIWKTRETQLDRMIMATARIYGKAQGIAGATAVPELPGLGLLESGEETEQKELFS